MQETRFLIALAHCCLVRGVNKIERGILVALGLDQGVIVLLATLGLEERGGSLHINDSGSLGEVWAREAYEELSPMGQREIHAIVDCLVARPVAA